MRVTFDAAHRQALAGLNTAATRLREFQQQVSSGKRIARPSDDASAAAAALVERGRLATADQYLATSDSAKGRLQVTDTVLSDIVRQISAAEVTVLAARGSIVTQGQREAYAVELEQLRDALLQNVNTSFRGSYIFGGAALTPPYTRNGSGVVSSYQGSAVEVAVDIDDARQVTVAFDGQSLVKGNDPDDLFVVLDRAITATRAGNIAALNTVGADLQRAFDRAALLQSNVGGSLRAIETGRVRLEAATRAHEAQMSDLVDVNLASAITSMTQAEAAYRAALGATSQMHRVSLMDYLR